MNKHLYKFQVIKHEIENLTTSKPKSHNIVKPLHFLFNSTYKLK